VLFPLFQRGDRSVTYVAVRKGEVLGFEIRLAGCENPPEISLNPSFVLRQFDRLTAQDAQDRFFNKEGLNILPFY